MFLLKTKGEAKLLWSNYFGTRWVRRVKTIFAGYFFPSLLPEGSLTVVEALYKLIDHGSLLS